MTNHHPNHPPRNTYGFTMVELAIVIVIISLLVGGIASLASYTTNAKLSAMMNEGKFYIDAYNKFQTKYNNPPGDYCVTSTACGTLASPTASNAWAGAFNGDGNGLIRAGGTAFDTEVYYSFQHLALAGFIPGTYTGAASGGGAKIGINVPGSSIDKSAFLFNHPDATSGFVTGGADTYFDGQYGNILTIGGLADNAAALPTGAFLTPKQALQLDEKYDDGVPSKGMVVSQNAAACANTTTYATGTLTKECYLIIKIQ